MSNACIQTRRTAVTMHTKALRSPYTPKHCSYHAHQSTAVTIHTKTLRLPYTPKHCGYHAPSCRRWPTVYAGCLSSGSRCCGVCSCCCADGINFYGGHDQMLSNSVITNGDDCVSVVPIGQCMRLITTAVLLVTIHHHCCIIYHHCCAFAHSHLCSRFQPCTCQALACLCLILPIALYTEHYCVRIRPGPARVCPPSRTERVQWRQCHCPVIPPAT